MGNCLGFEDAELNYDDTVAVKCHLQENYPFYDNGDGTYEFNL